MHVCPAHLSSSGRRGVTRSPLWRYSRCRTGQRAQSMSTQPCCRCFTCQASSRPGTGPGCRVTNAYANMLSGTAEQRRRLPLGRCERFGRRPPTDPSARVGGDLGTNSTAYRSSQDSLASAARHSGVAEICTGPATTNSMMRVGSVRSNLHLDQSHTKTPIIGTQPYLGR